MSRVVGFVSHQIVDNVEAAVSDLTFWILFWFLRDAFFFAIDSALEIVSLEVQLLQYLWSRRRRRLCFYGIRRLLKASYGVLGTETGSDRSCLVVVRRELLSVQSGTRWI
jgi:hypothetical protein